MAQNLARRSTSARSAFFARAQFSLLAILVMLAKMGDDWRSPGHSEYSSSYICPVCNRVAKHVPGPPPVICKRHTKSGRKHHPDRDVEMVPWGPQGK